MRHFLFILCFGSTFTLYSQYDYFNQITGDLNDDASEAVANVEVIDNAYVVWGGGINGLGEKFQFVRKYGPDGVIQNENILPDNEGEYVYGGQTISFNLNPFLDEFVFLNGVVLESQVEGYMIVFNQNLDTLFTSSYNHYNPYTYLIGFEVMPDGYLVLGEQGGISNSNGTFVMKLDFAGNILWSEILQAEVYQNIYRNWNIIDINSNYWIFGGGNTPETNFKPFGLITKINSVGITQSAITIADDDALRSNYLKAVKLENGEILVSQPISYELLDPNGSQTAFWNKIRLFKFNPETEEVYAQQDYFENYEQKKGRVFDMEATPDGGAIIQGRRYVGFYADMSWLMKVDSTGNQEWYQEYAYEICNDCRNLLFDIELAPDGGYIAAGSFANEGIDIRRATWLLKVDPCGDLEWQGCSPVGVKDVEKKRFEIYPNPTEGIVQIEIPVEFSGVNVIVTDIVGRIVHKAQLSAGTGTLNLRNLPSGSYIVTLESKEGKLKESHQIQIVR